MAEAIGGTIAGMGNILAIVSKAAFEKDADLGVGDVYATSEYVSKNKALDSVADNGSLFLVTARPGDALWLVGILESPVFVGDRWTAATNTVKVVDITSRMGELTFENGNGIQFSPGKLGMALQAPRRLTDDDVALLRELGGASSGAVAKVKSAAKAFVSSIAGVAGKVVSSVKSVAKKSVADDAIAEEPAVKKPAAKKPAATGKKKPAAKQSAATKKPAATKAGKPAAKKPVAKKRPAAKTPARRRP